MLETTRIPVLRRRMERLAKQVPDWDFGEVFGDLNSVIRVSTHQEIRDHYADVVDVLKRYAKWDSHRIADFIGIGRQTSYQYGFQPQVHPHKNLPGPHFRGHTLSLIHI